MGKLTEKIERMQKSAAPRLGFALAAAKQPSMLLIAVLPTANRNLATSALSNGADGILVEQPGSESGVREKLGISHTAVLGGTFTGTTDTKGWDFAVVDAAAPASSVLTTDGLDPVLRLEADTPDSVLRTLEALPVEAILLPDPGASLTLGGLIRYYRVTKATSKPVLSFVPVKPDPSVLRALRDAGIAGLLVEVANASSAKALADVKKAIEQLPPRRISHRRTRPAVALGLPISAPAPGPSGPPAPAPDEGDEDAGDE